MEMFESSWFSAGWCRSIVLVDPNLALGKNQRIPHHQKIVDFSDLSLF
jgi:hypothetical protein